MTGNSNAKGGGGSNLAVAWVYDYANKWPFVFEDGMTWGAYMASEYRLYDGDNGFVLRGTAQNINYAQRTSSGIGYTYIQANEVTCRATDKIMPDFQYIKTV